MKFPTRTVGVLIPASIVMISLITYGTISFYSSRHALLEAAGNKLNAVATAQRQATESLYESRVQRIRLVTSRTRLRQLLATPQRLPDDHAMMKRIMEDARASDPAITAFGFYTESGKSIATVGDLGETWFNKQITDDFSTPEDVLTFGYRLDEDGPRIAIASRTIVSPTKTVLSVFELKIDEIYSITENYNGLGVSGETLIARALPNGDAEFIVPLRHDPDAAFDRLTNPHLVVRFKC